MIMFLCDGILNVKNNTANEEEIVSSRFFKIAQHLHFDLQLVLVNRSLGKSSNYIPYQTREAGYHFISKLYSTKE